MAAVTFVLIYIAAVTATIPPTQQSQATATARICPLVGGNLEENMLMVQEEKGRQDRTGRG